MRHSRNPLIFVIERNKNYRHLIINSLAAVNFTNVRSFSSGEHCLRNLFRRPDFIIQDYELEGNINGMDVLLKTKRIHPATRIIFLTSHNNVDTAVEAIKMGATDYVLKTVYAISKITAILDRYRQAKKSLYKATVIQNSLVIALIAVFTLTLTMVLFYK